MAPSTSETPRRMVVETQQSGGAVDTSSRVRCARRPRQAGAAGMAADAQASISATQGAGASDPEEWRTAQPHMASSQGTARQAAT